MVCSNNLVAKGQELTSVVARGDELEFLPERFLQRFVYLKNSLISKVVLLDRRIKQSINQRASHCAVPSKYS